MKMIDRIFRFDNENEMKNWFCTMVSCGILSNGKYPVGIEYPTKCKLVINDDKNYHPIFSYYVSRPTEFQWRKNWNKILERNPELKDYKFTDLPPAIQNFIQTGI